MAPVLQTLDPPLVSSRRNPKPIVLVLHATAGASAKSSINHLRGVGLSYHYIIPRDGRDSAKFESVDGTAPFVFHCVANAREAFHAASQIPPPGVAGGINRNSIGISLANIQRDTNPEPYPKKQLEVLDELIQVLRQQEPTLKLLTAHALVQPWNRADPTRVNAKAIADRAGLQFWQPTQAQIDQHKP
jgi:N-acetyl-anhydromuramyl-L-alanine amidase AmpD